MKWFFGYNGHGSFKYDIHIRVMIRSAIANTSLEPHLIYFRDRDDPETLRFAEDHGVEVIQHEPSILADLRRIQAKFPDYHFHVATGAFLRIDLPLICRDLGYGDQFVLYTDLDVMFVRDIPDGRTPFLRPNLFSCGPESSKNDWTIINTGVMVVNVESLLEDHAAFKRFITSGDTLYNELFKQGPYDQAAYQIHYASRWDRLPAEYNWKPYWGYNEEAAIVHFHGPSIREVRRILTGKTDEIPEHIIELVERDPDAYMKYLDHVRRYKRD